MHRLRLYSTGHGEGHFNLSILNNRRKSLAANTWVDPELQPTFDGSMIRIVRKALAALLVLALACGNHASAFAEASEHVRNIDIAIPGHARAHHHSHAAHHAISLFEHFTAAKAAICFSEANCSSGEHQGGDRCCHVHAHCCLGLGLVPLGVSVVLRTDSSSKLTGPNCAPPHGGIVIPLLRPPRCMA